MKEDGKAGRELGLVVTGRYRCASPMDAASRCPPPPDPGIDPLLLAAGEARADDDLWISGGEPTLRGDLPEILARLGRGRAKGAGLDTDGLTLGAPGALEPFQDKDTAALGNDDTVAIAIEESGTWSGHTIEVPSCD